MVLAILTTTTTAAATSTSCLPTPVSPSTPAPPPYVMGSSSSSVAGKRAGLHIDTTSRTHVHPPTPVSPRASSSTTSSTTTPYPYYTPRRLRASSTAVATPTSALLSPADPYADITRLRLHPSTFARHPCLYPGSVFAGTQRSGRHAYDVRVTLATVDLRAPSAHLCGYLRIRGLTDEHPELTTYFDADICTTFRTPGGWGCGASEARDWQHWSRFPAFRRLHVRDLDARPPPPASGGPVFMRWKEQFLVPDHRVKDISGASFAGFYYVCVDLDAPPAASSSAAATRRRALTMPSLAAYDHDAMDVQTAVTGPGTCAKPSAKSSLEEPPRCAPLYENENEDEDEEMADAFADHDAEDETPPGTGALMSGFYFHPNSDPFQKLSLRHVKDESHAGFEFR